MNQRKVYISAYNLGALAAYNDTLNMPPLIEKLKAHPWDVEGLFYSTMIQGGIQRFQFFPSDKRSTKKSTFLSNRVSFFSEHDQDYSFVTGLIDKYFSNFLPDNYKKDDKYDPVISLSYFLVDLFFSIRKKTSIVCILPLPRLTKCEQLLPPELLIPIRNFFNTIETENANLPLIKKTVSHKDIKVVEDIISSDLFSQYCLYHKDLENSKKPVSIAISEVSKAGQRMLNKYSQVLDIRKLTMSLLPISSKLVDVLFGKLPEIFVEQVASFLGNVLKNEQRVVIYQLDPLFTELIHKRFAPYLPKK